jgi:hypothetical protein
MLFKYNKMIRQARKFFPALPCTTGTAPAASYFPLLSRKYIKNIMTVWGGAGVNQS